MVTKQNTTRSAAEGFDPANPLHVGMKIVELQAHYQEMQLMQTQSHQNARNAFESLQSEVHRIGEGIGQIALLAERQGNDNDSIRRIWKAIEATNNSVHLINKKVWVWSGLAIGISVMATCLVSVVAWVAQGYFDSGRYNDERLDRVELHLAGDSDRPYQRK